MDQRIEALKQRADGVGATQKEQKWNVLENSVANIPCYASH